jgi:hypothetical protein
MSPEVVLQEPPVSPQALLQESPALLEALQAELLRAGLLQAQAVPAWPEPAARPLPSSAAHSIEARALVLKPAVIPQLPNDPPR